MVTAPSACLLAILLMGQSPDAGSSADPDAEATRAVRSALGKGSYPWYDSKKDAIRPVSVPQPPRASRPPDSSRANWGNILSTTGFLLGLAALIAALVWFWRLYEPAEDETPAPAKQGEPSRIESLPEGMRREFESSDPWEEALRRRARGDFSGAVVCLFAHQLLTLSKLGLIRITPGRTGRQLLRSVADAEFRGLAQPTLRSFEAVYYGRRAPSAEEFAALWVGAEAFERRVARGVAS